MQNPTERRITVDIDVLVAIAGAIAGLELTIWLALQKSVNYLYPIISLLAFLACISYLVVKKRLRFVSISDLLAERRRKPSTYLLLNILFFVLMFCAVIAVALRPEIYSRPAVYFICLALASAVLAVEILWLPPHKSYSYFVLAKIMLLALTLIWTPQVIFPSLLGQDPFFHAQFTQAILDNAHVPAGEPYSSFAVFHLTAGTTMLLTGMSYKVATMLSTCLIYVIVGLSFIFLLGRFVHSSKIGLFAALLLGCSSLYVQYGWWMVPNGYAVIFLPVVAYLLFKARSQHPVLLIGLSMLLMGVLILTHTIGALTVAIVLFLFWLGHQVYLRVYEARFKIPVTLTLFILFSVTMFAWWIYASGFAITQLQYLIRTHFAIPLAEQPLEASLQYILTVPFGENLFRNLASPLLWALSFLGCLAAFSARFGNRYSFVLAIGGLVLLAIGFISLPLNLGVIPGRWQIASMFLLAIPAAFGLLLFCGALRGNALKVLVLSVSVAVLSFISITNPNANIDNPMIAKNTTVRYAFEESEQQAMTTISNLWDGFVTTDGYYFNLYPRWNERDMTNNLIDKDFSDQENTMVIVRKEIVERPFDLEGVFKLDYDPREVLRAEGFSQIYDCGTVSGFLPNVLS